MYNIFCVSRKTGNKIRNGVYTRVGEYVSIRRTILRYNTYYPGKSKTAQV